MPQTGYAPQCAVQTTARGPAGGVRGATSDPCRGGGNRPQELKRCCVFSRPSEISDSTASAASETWNGSSLRSTVE